VVKYQNGEMMIKQENIEQLFKVIDTGASIYSIAKEVSYMDGIALICEGILNQEAALGLDFEKSQQINRLIKECSAINYQKEEIRKAMQLAILKGLRASGRSNEQITPDTLGIFIAYLVQKLIPENRPLVLFDPLAGTGNLLVTVMNQLAQSLTAILVEADEQIAKIARVFLAMLEYNDDIYCQDTLTFKHIEADIMITDFSFPKTTEETMFPYQVFDHHKENLRDDALVIAVIPDAFFDPEHQERFKKELLGAYRAIGLIRLPQDLFSRRHKSILILKKGPNIREEKPAFLMADIPSFADQDAFQPVLEKINQWFRESTLQKG